MIKSKLRLFGWAVGLSLALGAVGAVAAQGAPVETKATDPTAVYTVTSTSAVSSSGTIRSGSSATYTQSYSTACQATGGNYFALTLSGYSGCTITNLTLSMHSNKKAGSGTLKYKNGSSSDVYLVGASGSGVTFSNSNWNGAWSQDYVSISKDINVLVSGDFVITIDATANSLFCESYSITYQAPQVLNSVSVATAPGKTTGYKAGESVDLTGLVVTPTINSSPASNVTYNSSTNAALFTTNPAILAANTTSVQIGYRLTSTGSFVYDTANPVAITMSTAEVNGIVIDADAITGKTWYNVDTLDLTGLKFMLSYDDDTFGDEVTIGSNSDFAAKGLSLYEGESDVDLSQPLTSGAHTFIVKYGDKSDTFSLDVTARIVSSLAISGQRKSFTTIDTFSVEGGTITATYNNGDQAAIPSNDSHLSYRVEEDNKTKFADLVIGETMMIADFAANSRKVQIYYDNGAAGDPAKLGTRYSVTVSVIEDYSKGAFYQVTSDQVDWSGHYILVHESKVFNGIDETSDYQTASIFATKKRIEYHQNFGVIELASMTGGYSARIMTRTNATKYMGGKSGSNTLTLSDDPILNTITFADGYITMVSDSTTLRFNTATGTGNDRFRYYKPGTTTDTYPVPTIYKWVSNEDKVQEFVNGYMHLTDYVEEWVDEKPVYLNYCKDQAHNYYGAAKTEFNLLTQAQRELFWSGEAYATAAQRLDAWRVAKGDLVNEDTKILEANRGSISPLSSGHGNTPIIIAAFAGIGALAVGGMIFLRKRKEF